MKNQQIKSYLIALCLSAIAGIAHAQCWTTINTVTTDWNSSQSANTFDWTQEEYDYFYLKKYYNPTTGITPPTTLTMPMWQEQSSSNNNLNLVHFQLQSASQKDHKPTDGWELLTKNFGECCTESKAVENPFFAIYNRYTGVIRAYTYIARTPSNLNLNGAIMRLEFNNVVGSRKTAMLQHLTPIANAVKEFNPGNFFQVPNHYKNSSYWLFAEFQTAYDPCGCTYNQNSLITFRVALMQNTTIDAKLEGTINENVVQNDPSTGKSAPASDAFFSIGGVNLSQAVNEGMKGYKNWEGYRKQAASFLDKQDQKYKDKLAADLFASGDVYIDGVKMNSVNDIKNLNNGWKKLLGIDVGDPQVKALKGLASALPYVGTALALWDFFSGGGAESSDVKAVRSPMAFDAKLTLQGTLSTVADQEVITIYTPGTKTSASNSMPVYNNTLGVVNVMKVPKLEYVTYAPSEANAYPSAAKIRQYRLSEDVKYVLNPASNLEIVSADAAIVVEYKDNSQAQEADDIVLNTPNLINDVDQVPVVFETFSTSADMSNYYAANDVVKRLTWQGWELEYIANNYLSNFGNIRFRTKYVPLNCLRHQAFALNWRHFSNAMFRNAPPKIYIKIIFRLKVKNSTTADPITQVMSFLIPNATAEAVPFTTTEYQYEVGRSFHQSNPPFAAWTWNSRGYVGNSIFPSNINAPSYITFNNGNVIDRDVYANKRVTINNGVTINPGVSIYAGEGIDIYAPNVVQPTVKFVVGGRIGNCDGDILNMHETNTNITGVCSSTEYNNRAFSKTGPMPGDKKTEEIFHADWKSTIKPNPSSGDFYIELTGTSQPETEIEVVTLMGQSVYKATLTNAQVENKVYFMRDMDLANGVYLVHVKNANKTDVTKLVITR